jgi:hypothetical protein
VAEYHRSDSTNTPEDAPCSENSVSVWRIITRRQWDAMQAEYVRHPGSSLVHIYAGVYVLTTPAEATS